MFLEGIIPQPHNPNFPYPSPPFFPLGWLKIIQRRGRPMGSYQLMVKNQTTRLALFSGPQGLTGVWGFQGPLGPWVLLGSYDL